MRANKIEAGKVYEITVGKNKTTMKVVKIERRVNGQIVFDCLNTKTNKRMTVSDAKRFLKEVVTKTERAKGVKPNGKLSGLEAAYRVLADAGRPMNVREIFEIAVRNKYCDLKGATPTLTIYAAMMREIMAKKTKSRFTKVGKGLFAAR
jgi:hypothetical protein